MVYNLKVKIIQEKDINLFIGIVPGLPGAHSQASTLEELYRNLQDVIHLCLDDVVINELL